MQNKIKRPDETTAIQITRPAREAGLVAEDSEDDPVRLAPVLVYSTDGVVLVFDRERVSPAVRAEIVASAARETGAIYQGNEAAVAESGNGYQVSVTGALDAGFQIGDTATLLARQGLVIAHTADTAKISQTLIKKHEELIS